MSDTYLRLIPADPHWQPSVDAADAAATLLRTLLPAANRVEAQFSDDVIFFDPGANWSGVNCCACGADAEGWWGDAIDACATNGFATLEVPAACCGAKVSLNDLKYGAASAFGRFVLEVLNPDVPEISESAVRDIAARLGNPLRVVWVHI